MSGKVRELAFPKGENANLGVGKENPGGGKANLSLRKANPDAGEANLAARTANPSLGKVNLGLGKANLTAEKANPGLRKANLRGGKANPVLGKANRGPFPAGRGAFLTGSARGGWKARERLGTAQALERVSTTICLMPSQFPGEREHVRCPPSQSRRPNESSLDA